MKHYSRNWTGWAKSKVPSLITVTYKIKEQQQLPDNKLKATHETQKYENGRVYTSYHHAKHGQCYHAA